MIAAALECELRIPGVESLKEKRSHLRPLVEGLKRVASVSVAELNHQNDWQRATIGIALVSRPGEIDRLVAQVERHLRGRPDIEVVRLTIGFFDTEEQVPNGARYAGNDGRTPVGEEDDRG